MHERRYRSYQTKARKHDTRVKIQLGGLVIKAGLGKVDKAITLGLLLEGADHLNDERACARFAARGKEAFENDRKEDSTADRAVSDDDSHRLGNERD